MSYNRKRVSNFNFSLVFVGKIKLNFHYKKMNGKYMTIYRRNIKIAFFRFQKYGKRFSNFDINSAFREKTHWVVQWFGNKVVERFSLTSRAEHPN